MRKLRRRTLVGLVYPAMAGCGLAACSASYDDGENLGSVAQALIVTQTFREGMSGYNGTTDSCIAQKDPSSNFGSSTICHLDGDDGGNDEDKSCLIRWALTGVPADAVITSATITLRALDAGDTYQLYQLKRPFSESQATWSIAASGNAWGTPGAFNATDRGPVIGSLSGSSGSKVVSLNADGLAMVQGWLNAANNHGIVIANTASKGGIDLASSEHGTTSYRPQLSITYTTSTGGGRGR